MAKTHTGTNVGRGGQVQCFESLHQEHVRRAETAEIHAEHQRAAREANDLRHQPPLPSSETRQELAKAVHNGDMSVFGANHPRILELPPGEAPHSVRKRLKQLTNPWFFLKYMMDPSINVETDLDPESPTYGSRKLRRTAATSTKTVSVLKDVLKQLDEMPVEHKEFSRVKAELIRLRIQRLEATAERRRKKLPKRIGPVLSSDAGIRAEHAQFGSVPDTSHAQAFVRPLEAMRRPDGAPSIDPPHLADPGTLLPRRKEILTPDDPGYEKLGKRDRYVQGMVQLARQELAQQALVEEDAPSDESDESEDMVFSEVEGELVESRDLTPFGVPVELADLGDGLDEDEPIDMSVILLRKGRGGPKPSKKKSIAGRPKVASHLARLSDRDYSVEEVVSIITRVKEKMAALRITHQDLADFMGCTKQAIWQWFTGRAAPRHRQVDLMVRFLDTRVVSADQVALPEIKPLEGGEDGESQP